MTLRAITLWFLLSTTSAAAALPELAGRIASAQPAGCAEYTFLAASLYRAELWTDAPSRPGDAFALSLVYRRGFDWGTLVATSIDEMARMSGRSRNALDAARRELAQAFRSVEKGDRFTAWRGAPGRVEFFLNGNVTGTLTHDADLFLDIWLGPETRSLKRRDELLSGRCDD